EFMLLLRQSGRLAFAGAVTIKSPKSPLGTHLFTLQAPTNAATSARGWSVLTLKTAKDAADKPVAVSQVLDRLEIPPHVRLAITDRLTPDSSLIVTDSGSELETGLMTDFIVLTR
ncbi:MAG: hypothetical protein KDJ36_02780, partial [Hyphomicrobiaceae bacterium]|nr:hypothetical protein [Hyphomicrobiaceae bacterium]